MPLKEQIATQPKWLHGIRARLFITLSLILLVVGAVALAGFLQFSHHRELADLQNRGRILVDVQAIALRFPLWNLNNDQVQTILNMLKGTDDFTGAKIVDPQYNLVASVGEEYNYESDYRFRKQILHTEAGIVNNLGYLEIYLSTDEIKSQFLEGLANGIFALLIVIVLMFFAFWVSLSSLVIGPLRKLMSVMSHIARGDFGKKLEIGRKDEFGTLAHLFNKMTSELSEMYQVIEKKVDERTAELTITNKALQHAQEKATKAADLLKIEKEKSERLLVDALEISPAAMVLLDKDHRVVRWNQNLIKLNPEALRGKMVVGTEFQPIFDLVVNDSGRTSHKYFTKGTQGTLNVEQQLNNGNWVKLTLHPTRDNYSALMFVDITDMKARENDIADQAEKLRQSEQKYALAAHGANDGLWDYTLANQQLYCSPRFKDMLGYDENEIGFNSLETWYDRIHPDELEDFKYAFDAHLKGVIPRFKIEYRIRHKTGGYHWMLCRGLAARGPDGVAIRIAGSQTDITMQKNYEQELLHTAYHDPLTGLPNREFFMRRLADCLEDTRKDKTSLTAVLFLDLDRFKVVNDSLGHDVGDKLLIGISQRIKKCLRPQDFAARLGGDEFTVLVRSIPDSDEAQAVASRILDELRVPYHIDGHEVFASASIGITMLTDTFVDVDSLIRNADLAMYRAKSKGRSRFELFDQEMHTQVVNEMKIETDLRRALEKDEIKLFYQPIMDIVSNELTGFEGLMRWHYNNETMMNIGKFMPIAEVTGLILPLGEHICELACNQLKEWLTMIGPENKFSVAINLSVCQIRDIQYMQKLIKKIGSYNFPAGYLKIEVTESAVMDDLEQITTILGDLKEVGVQLCIDDFGTGYSSFSYLHKFPFDVLKIDQSFIHRMSESEKMVNMVRGIINLSHDLGLLVVGEGIETEQQLEFLKKLRCDFGQGYLFAKPMPVEDATEHIKRSRLPKTEQALIRNILFPPAMTGS